ncbi:hypothetical protein CMUS01_10580 [Colletotrichum musicola]|uniref:Uncharacterized protein n=1 Tax=Colletotrichum musicola TaxID=2175873 RepID=A0A8H6K3B0_9PEZI|nr:hypothetical protein CMUS01_10580 [Colletotrichum musicola]
MGSSSPPMISQEDGSQPSEFDIRLHELFRPPSTGQVEPSQDKHEPHLYDEYKPHSDPNRSSASNAEEYSNGLSINISQQNSSKKRKTNRLAAYMARTTSSIAFAKFEKLLDESPQPRNCLSDTANLKLGSPSVYGEPNTERLDAYPSRPFQGADFDVPLPSLETNEAVSAADTHADTEDGEEHTLGSNSTVELAALARITDKITTVSKEIRLSDSQLADARERLAEVNCEVRELAETFSRSWQEIESWRGNPRDTPNWDATPGLTKTKITSFNTIEVQLKDLTRKKRLIESEIQDREAKKKSVDEAMAAFLTSEKWTDLETLEDAANDYVPMTTGL